MRKGLLFIYIVLSTCLPVISQSVFVKTFSVDENTNRNIKINKLYKSPNGIIWVCTNNGIYKFDGQRFQQIELKDKNARLPVTALFEDNKGTLWIGTEVGDIYTITNFKAAKFTPQEGTPKVIISAFAQTKDSTLWFSTKGEGLYYYKNNRLFNWNTDDGLSDNYVYSIALVNTNSVLVTTDQGLNLCQIISGKKETRKYSSANGLPDNIVRVAVQSPLTKLFWLGMQDEGICSFDPLTGKFQPTVKWEYGQVNAVTETASEIWIATESKGVFVYDKAQNLNPLKTLPLFAFNKVDDMLQDNEGNIWIAQNGQLIKTNGSQIKYLDKLGDIPLNNVHSVFADSKDNLWFTPDQGLVKHNLLTGENKNYTLTDKNKLIDITCIAEGKTGLIWIGTMGAGIFRIDPEKNIIKKLDLGDANPDILSMAITQTDIWLTTLGGVYKAINPPGDADINTTFKFESLAGQNEVGKYYVYKVFADSKERVWLATDGKGITMYNNGTFKNFSQKDGLTSEVFYSVAEGVDGSIWFNSYKSGLFKYANGKFTNYAGAYGLTDFEIEAIETDETGKPIIAAKKGIDILYEKDNTFFHFGKESGLDNNIPQLNAITKDKRGNIYIGCEQGILVIRNCPLRRDNIANPVIEKTEVFLNPVEPGITTFSHSDNNFTFTYTAIHYTEPGRIQYQYKLDGLNADWITSADRQAFYPKLLPGTYTFRVRASPNGNFANAKEATYSFTIHKPFWGTWWFTLLAIITGAGLLYWFIKARESRINKVERLEKEKIFSELENLKNQVNPHFLFNSFNTLIGIIEEEPKEATEYVQKLSDFYRNIVTYRDKDLIPLQDELNLLYDYFYLQKKRFGDSLTFSVDIPANLTHNILIPPLTLQMLAENAVKHNTVSRSMPLNFTVTYQTNYIEVSNNINKKITKAESTGLGLQNIDTRFKLIAQQSIKVINDGKTFKIQLPLISKV
jgi:ligand-binding sensor domain-containing protein